MFRIKQILYSNVLNSLLCNYYLLLWNLTDDAMLKDCNQQSMTKVEHKSRTTHTQRQSSLPLLQT